MIRIDSLWLAVEPMDMRAGAERLLTSLVQLFGSAQARRERKKSVVDIWQIPQKSVPG